MATVLPQAERLPAPFRWMGGKGRLAPWVVEHLPPGEVYVEPYAGSAAVFWNRRPSPVEVLNDLDGNIVNLYRVLQDRGLWAELEHRLTFTPYSREEFRRAIAIGHEPTPDPVTNAWAFFVRQNQGFGGFSDQTPGRWGRTFDPAALGNKCTTNYQARIAKLERWHARLRGCVIESVDAVECVRLWDSPRTTFYLDPPYPAATRSKTGKYWHEMDDDHHAALVARLLSIEGAAVLSGYDNPIYAPLLAAWWTQLRRGVWPIVPAAYGGPI